MDLLALADFNAVAIHGGFGQASRKTGRPKATLSRRVAALEESLGVRLLERGAGASRLTEEGAALHARTEGLLAEIAAAGAAAGAAATVPRGRLRISVPVLFGEIAIGRIAALFVRACPSVLLDVVSDDRVLDPVEDGFDLVIRVDPRPDDRLVGRPILREQRLLVAPPGLARPASGEVAAVLFKAEEPASWRIRGEDGPGLVPVPVARLSSLPLIRDAVLHGAGAAVLPHSLVRDDVAAGRLVRWGVSDRPDATIWALHASRRMASAKLRAFLAVLSDAFPDGELR